MTSSSNWLINLSPNSYNYPGLDDLNFNLADDGIGSLNSPRLTTNTAPSTSAIGSVSATNPLPPISTFMPNSAATTTTTTSPTIRGRRTGGRRSTRGRTTSTTTRASADATSATRRRTSTGRRRSAPAAPTNVNNRRSMNQSALRNQIGRLANQERQRGQNRRIASVTHTSTITTTYKDGRPPSVNRTSNTQTN